MKTITKTPCPGILEEIDEIAKTHDLSELFGTHDRPENVWIIRLGKNLHGIYVAEGIHGLAACAKKKNIERLLHLIKTSAFEPHKFELITFDEALDIAKDKPEPIRAVILCDSLADPKIFYAK